MKIESVHLVNRILAAILVLLGFSSCGKDNDNLGDIPVEYGTPSVNYQIKGTVTDKSGTPIKDIKVVVNYIPQTTAEDRTVYTDANGQFSTWYWCAYSSKWDKPTITFEDTDGEDNGGLFKTATLDANDMAQTELPIPEDNHWCVGNYELTADVKLEKEE
ncbi:MAG: radical SAM-associated putative lipoprotein [Alistipes sp.]